MVSPHEYRALRNELDCLWGLDSLPGIALSSQDRGEDSTVKHDGSSNSQIVISSNQTSINLDSSLSSCTTADSTPGAAQASGSPDSQESGGERQGPSLSIATDGTVSESACRKVVQSPSGVSLKLAEKPAASSNAAITVLDLRRSTAHPDSPEALDIAPAITAQVSAAELTRLSQHGSSEGTSSSGTSTAEVVQDPLDPPFAAQAALERQATNALASSSGRGQGSPAGEGSRARSPRRRRRQLTSRKEHWAAKAAAAVVAEAAKVGVSREPGKRRTLRRPPSLKLTPEQLEVGRMQTPPTPLLTCCICEDACPNLQHGRTFVGCRPGVMAHLVHPAGLGADTDRAALPCNHFSERPQPQPDPGWAGCPAGMRAAATVRAQD